MEETHKLIGVYGNSIENKFPLILVLTDEPNTDLPLRDGIGEYEFYHNSKVNTWNNIISWFERIIGKPKTLKDLFHIKNSSFLIISHAKEVEEVKQIDKTVSHNTRIIQQQYEQAKLIFNHSSLINRVQIIILANGDSRNHLKNYIKQFAKDKDIAIIDFGLHKFNYRNLPPGGLDTLIEYVSDEQRNLILSIYNEWQLS